MNMVFHKPKSEVLQKYMEGYYFIYEDEQSNTIRYKTFPNNYIILSISQNADVLYEEHKITIAPSLGKQVSTDLVIRYTYPIEVVYVKAVNELTFYFKPLGLNHFIPDTHFFTQYKSLMKFEVLPDFNDAMLHIFEIEDREKQIEAIEEYWLSKLQTRDFSLMEQLLQDIESTDLKIEQIAAKYNFSRQYINKLFLKHIGKTPSEYRKIHRFRSTLKKKNEIKNLTKLSHDHLFYDQSHFNKDFKELTSSKPSSFFKHVDIEKENVWLFI